MQSAKQVEPLPWGLPNELQKLKLHLDLQLATYLMKACTEILFIRVFIKTIFIKYDL